MPTLTYNEMSYVVDHAVKGTDYIHGYDANNKEVVAFEGITDFTQFEYSGEFLAPKSCAQEACNIVRNVNNTLRCSDGSFIKHLSTPYENVSIVCKWADIASVTTKTSNFVKVTSIVPYVNTPIIEYASDAADVLGVTTSTPGFILNHVDDAFYANGSLRPEYAFVNILGIEGVRDDDTCRAGGYCVPSANGCATSYHSGYKVIERTGDESILIMVEPQASTNALLKEALNNKLGKTLVEGVDYGDKLPAAGTPGRIFFKKV